MKRLFFLLVSALWLFSAALAAAQTSVDQDEKYFQIAQRSCDNLQKMNNIVLLTLGLIQKTVGEHDYYWAWAQKIKLSVDESDKLVTQAKNLLDQANDLKDSDIKQALEKIEELFKLVDQIFDINKDNDSKLTELVNALTKQPGPSPKIKI